MISPRFVLGGGGGGGGDEKSSSVYTALYTKSHFFSLSLSLLIFFHRIKDGATSSRRYWNMATPASVMSRSSTNSSGE